MPFDANLLLSPAFALPLAFLVVIVLGLGYCNWRLRARLRATGCRPALFQPEGVPAPATLPVASAEHSPGGVSPVSVEPAPVGPSTQQRLVEAEQQLQAVQGELAALSYSVSHELRAPLRAITGFSQALAEDYAHILDATAQEYLQRVRANSRLMSELIEDLLALSRLARAPMQRQLVQLAPVAESIMVELRKAEAERMVTLEIQPGLCACADPVLMENTLRQLLGNAWKFSSRRTEAHISLRACVAAGLVPGSREIVYEIRDDGAGFDMNYAGRLFGAFQRMHSAEEYPGNGIGLAAVQRMVRRHGGRVWAESVLEGGTTILFTLGSWEQSAGSQVCESLERAGQFPADKGSAPATSMSLAT